MPDIIFKRIFGNDKNEDIIAAFVSDMLDIPRDRVSSITIKNVELTPENFDQKFSRLDLNMDVDGKKINIEMHINNEPDFKERTLFYWAKLYSELKQTICINIINFNLFSCDDYHSYFRIKENERDEVLTDKFAIHFFELQKVNSYKKNKRMENWLNLINSETEGYLMIIQQSTTILEVKKTIVMLREKCLHDEASALGYAIKEGEAIPKKS